MSSLDPRQQAIKALAPFGKLTKATATTLLKSYAGRHTLTAEDIKAVVAEVAR